MALEDELQAVTKALSGIGIDENLLISALGKWNPVERKSFRKETSQFFLKDDRHFERWDDQQVKLLKREFLRFKNAMVLWTMHPWERDARLAKEALRDGPQSYGIIIEIACTRSSEELLGARRAYHSLFDHSIEEDLAYHISGSDRKLLVGLVSSYRYEGPRVNVETAQIESQTLHTAIKNAHKKKPNEDEEVVRILATRSKAHLKTIFNIYKETYGHNIHDELEVDPRIEEAVLCLGNPATYFSKALDEALKSGSDENTKEALTRVTVTRSDYDIKEIKEEYNRHFGVPLCKSIEDKTHGNYKHFLLTLLARGD